MISIFNGRVRTLGGPNSDVHAQISVDFRQYLHLLKGARLAVFLAIALHADEEGWAYPSYSRLQQETGYGRGTIASALADLCEMTIEGHRLLLRYQPRGDGEKFQSNRYLIFPSPDEVAQYDEAGVQHLGAEAHRKKPCTTFPYTEKPYTEKPCTENPNTNHNQEEPEPSCHDDDGPLALVAGFGLDLSQTVRRLAPQYSLDQLTYAWQRAQQGRRPKGLFVSYLKSGDMPDPPEPSIPQAGLISGGEKQSPEPGDPQAHQLWEEAKADLACQMTRGTYSTWIKPTKALDWNGALRVEVPTPAVLDWLENRLKPTIERTLASVAGGAIEVQFVVAAREVGQ